MSILNTKELEDAINGNMEFRRTQNYRPALGSYSRQSINVICVRQREINARLLADDHAVDVHNDTFYHELTIAKRNSPPQNMPGV